MDRDVDADLLKILVCPESRMPLVRRGDWLYSTDPRTRRRYAIRDGIPIMLADESEVVEESEFQRVMAEAGCASIPSTAARSQAPGGIPVVK